MKTNKAIDYAIIALRYWSEQTEMGKQVSNEATAVLNTLREDESVKVTLELSRASLKRAFAIDGGDSKATADMIRTLFSDNNEVTIEKDALSTEGAASIITTLVNDLSK